jgi:hypothetical protein
MPFPFAFAWLDALHAVRHSHMELDVIAERERLVMATLTGNMTFCGTTAAKFAQATKDTIAAPNWTNVGTDFQTWMQTLWQPG